MHTRRMVVAITALCALFVSVWMLPDAIASEGAREPAKPLAEMSLSAGRIDWLPVDASEPLVLTVAGPAGIWVRKEFPVGQPASLSLSDPEWEHLPDGTYTWELRAISPPGKLPRKPLVESGHFFVKDGSFVAARQKASATPQRKPRLITAESHINDHLSVTGNLCVGTSCTSADPDPNLPSLILKAPQPHIRFDDQFVEGGSTPHDWAVFINPSSAAEFSIVDVENALFPFTIAGGAPNSSVYVAGNGNLGLGTATPAQDIHALSGNTPTLRLEQDGSGGLSTRTWDIGANHTELFVKDVTNSSSVPFRIKAGAPNDTLVVSSDGRVGIGTANPSTLTRLDVRANLASSTTVRLHHSSATGFPGIEYFDNAGSASLFFGLDNANNFTRLNSFNNKPFVIMTNSSERMRVTSVGNIGIGTSTPSSRLHVNGGDIRVSGGSFIDDGVTLNAPDYVFEPSYSLMPLAELREFVAREKHLPNVPAAADIKKEGLNLGQFQMRLLEKIEELALYTLKQEEQLREQQEHVQSLRDENRELKARLEALEKALQPKP